MTPSAALLWALAFFVAGALAYWDFTQSSSNRAAPSGQPPPEGPDAGEGPAGPPDVEIEILYEEP